MGSFTEVVLAFSFRPDTPDHVLAAFSGLHVQVPTAPWQDPAPPLPAPFGPVDEAVEWEPSGDLADPALDPEPWAHDWSFWLRHSMSVDITPSAQLVWSEMGRWHLSCRWGMKSDPESILRAIVWLAPYIDDLGRRPVLLGHMSWDGEVRPTLVWFGDGRIVPEHLEDD